MPLICKTSTQSDYCSILKNHLRKAPFYKKPVAEITEDDIEKYLTGKRRKLAKSTCVHIKNALSNSFKRAVKARVIITNPCKCAETPEGKDEVKELAETYK